MGTSVRKTGLKFQSTSHKILINHEGKRQLTAEWRLGDLGHCGQEVAADSKKPDTTPQGLVIFVRSHQKHVPRPSPGHQIPNQQSLKVSPDYVFPGR